MAHANLVPKLMTSESPLIVAKDLTILKTGDRNTPRLRSVGTLTLLPAVASILQLLSALDAIDPSSSAGGRFSDWAKQFEFWQSGLNSSARTGIAFHALLLLTSLLMGSLALKVGNHRLLRAVALVQALVCVPGMIWNYSSFPGGHRAPPTWL